MIEKGKIQKRLEELEEDYSKEVFNGVEFITFNKQSDAEIYEKLFMSIKIYFDKFIWFIYIIFWLMLFNSKKKKRLKIKNKISVSFVPETEDIIFEHLEYYFLSRLLCTFILYILSIILVGISFVFVLGINHIQ